MDDLTRINGIGKATAKMLATAGVTSFAQLAGLNVDQEPAKELGVKASWISEAMSFATEASQDTKGKPLGSDHEPEAHLQDGTGLPADSGAGDPQTNTPEGSSGTAREASGTGGGTAAETPNVGAQPGSPQLSADTPSLKTADGGSGDPAAPAFDLSAWVVEGGIVEAERRWPLATAALSAFSETITGEYREPLLQITAKREGFRRAGVAHSKAPTEHPLTSFTSDQVEQLFAEPNLVVKVVLG